MVKQQKLAVMKEQLDKLERAECTFQPSLIASTMKDMSSSQRFRLDKSACEDSVQYFQRYTSIVHFAFMSLRIVSRIIGF